MKHLKTFEQYHNTDVNEGIRDAAHELIDGATSLFYVPKKRILKLLNNEDATEEEMKDLVIDLFKLDSTEGQEKKLNTINNMGYNEILQLLSKILNSMEHKAKKPNLILKNNTLSLAN